LGKISLLWLGARYPAFGVDPVPVPGTRSQVPGAQ